MVFLNFCDTTSNANTYVLAYDCWMYPSLNTGCCPHKLEDSRRMSSRQSPLSSWIVFSLLPSVHPGMLTKASLFCLGLSVQRWIWKWAAWSFVGPFFSKIGLFWGLGMIHFANSDFLEIASSLLITSEPKPVFGLWLQGQVSLTLNERLVHRHSYF